MRAPRRRFTRSSSTSSTLRPWVAGFAWRGLRGRRRDGALLFDSRAPAPAPAPPPAAGAGAAPLAPTFSAPRPSTVLMASTLTGSSNHSVVVSFSRSRPMVPRMAATRRLQLARPMPPAGTREAAVEPPHICGGCDMVKVGTLLVNTCSGCLGGFWPLSLIS